MTNASNPSRRQWLQSALAVSGLALLPGRAFAGDESGIVHNADAIHQEVVFKATVKRVYEALTDAAQFQKVELLSAASKSMDVNASPAAISRDPGGAFSLFGGYVTGRQVELVPNQRIVQVWRSASWASGAYSLAKFELADQGSATKLVFDHTGFPAGTAEHLATGWNINYWTPMKKFLE
jgi:activator of HSP90 ATPase